MYLIPCSDSSMGDGNVGALSADLFNESVQIPLWAMVTALVFECSYQMMPVQIPLWAMVTFKSSDNCLHSLCSDSSMGDGNIRISAAYYDALSFRFLYGRW